MPYAHGTAIKIIEARDGTRHAEIVARHDVHFQIFEFVKLSEENGGRWGVGRMSGLYASAEDAEKAARADFSF